MKVFSWFDLLVLPILLPLGQFTDGFFAFYTVDHHHAR